MKRKICYITTIALTVRAFFIPQLKYLAQNGYDVTVICSPDENLKCELGESVRFLPVKIARGISPTLFGSIISLYKIFKSEKFDIVQYSTPNAAFVASVAAKMAHIKVRNYHLMGIRYLGMKGVMRRIFKCIEKVTCSLSTHIECITKSNLKLAIDEHIFNKEKATIVWNGSTGGVDVERFSLKKRAQYKEETRKNLEISPDEFVFGFVGRITRDKGINEMLSAFYGIDKECKLLIVGNKEDDTIDKVLWEKALDDKNVIIRESVSDIEKYYPAIDVLLLPSYREGFGMVIAEAAAMGTPAIVSNIPGPVDVVIPEETALLINVKDTYDLQEKMEIFLDNPDLPHKMSEKCAEFVADKFDSNILCRKILERKDKLKV